MQRQLSDQAISRVLNTLKNNISESEEHNVDIVLADPCKKEEYDGWLWLESYGPVDWSKLRNTINNFEVRYNGSIYTTSIYKVRNNVSNTEQIKIIIETK